MSELIIADLMWPKLPNPSYNFLSCAYGRLLFSQMVKLPTFSIYFIIVENKLSINYFVNVSPIGVLVCTNKL